MAKRAKPKYIPNPEPSDVGDPNVFITSTGKKVTIKGLSPMLVQKINESVPFPEPPTYEAETASGDIEKHYHDETTLETDEDKAAWEQFLADRKEAQSILQERMYKAVLMKGIEYSDDDEEEWVDLQKFLGIDIPDDPMSRKYHYIETEVIGNAGDLVKLMERVMESSGLPQELLAEARESFQRAMEGENTA